MSGKAPIHEVFISYSTKDKTWADAACAVLEGHKVRCWIAPRDITPGTEWGAAINDGIDACRIMVLVFSANANNSAQVRREVELAISKGMPVIPLRVEEVLPLGAMKYALSNTHWLDAFTPPVERQMTVLAESVQTLLGKHRTPAGVDTADTVAPAQKTEGSGRQTRARQAESAAAGKRAPQATAGPRGSQLSWPILTAAAAGVLVVGLVALRAAGVFRSKESPSIPPTAETGTTAVASAQVIPNRFVPLFNGKDLTGWYVDSGDPGAWQVKNGELCVRARESFTLDPVDQGYLLSEREYKDFHLSFQFRRITDSANSAVAVRAVPHETARNSMPDAKKASPFHLMIWIGKPQDRDGTGALVWSPHSVIQPPLLPDRSAELKPSGEWDDMEIEMQGQHLRTMVNGREVLNVRLNQTRPAKNPAVGLNRYSGRIGFLKRSGEMRFRNIQIKELVSDIK